MRKKRQTRQEKREKLREDFANARKKKLSESSLPTNQPVLDFALDTLFKSVIILNDMKWTMADIVSRAEDYLKLDTSFKISLTEMAANGEINENNEIQVVDNYIKLFEEERYKNDLNDLKVQETISFLKDTEEGKEISSYYGF